MGKQGEGKAGEVKTPLVLAEKGKKIENITQVDINFESGFYNAFY